MIDLTVKLHFYKLVLMLLDSFNTCILNIKNMAKTELPKAMP